MYVQHLFCNEMPYCSVHMNIQCLCESVRKALSGLMWFVIGFTGEAISDTILLSRSKQDICSSIDFACQIQQPVLILHGF